MRRAVPALLAATSLALALTGCRVPEPTHPVPQPTTTRPAPTTSATATTTPAPTTAPTVTVIPGPTTKPPTSVPTTTTTTVRPTTTVPPDEGDTAAERLGWGKPSAGDEFDGTAVNGKLWGVYKGAGHGGNGRRDPSAFTVAGGVLTVTGDSAGTTGGMAWHDGQYLGRWEVRMRVPSGDREYSAVALLWPDAEDWPVGGEVDFFEARTASRATNFFLHYGKDNRQTQASHELDLTQWHNYAVAWDAKCVTGYVDGEQWFQDCELSHLPPRAAHVCLQLDWFPDGSRTEESAMQVDYVRLWDL